jgi:hypothetical protein
VAFRRAPVLRRVVLVVPVAVTMIIMMMIAMTTMLLLMMVAITTARGIYERANASSGSMS